MLAARHSTCLPSSSRRVAQRSAMPVAQPGRHSHAVVVPRRDVLVRAEAEDFDAFLNKMADRFEKADNKPLVIGYVAAALGAFFTAEWFIHLPGMNIILGFPIQLLGLLMLPYLGVRWFVDGESAGKDIEAATGKIISKLPGLEKK